MSQVILDMGSGNTCGNSIDYARRMIDSVVDMDKKRHEVIFKWQLEKSDPPGQKKLDHDVYEAAWRYAKERDYKTTASIFDIESLGFLLGYDPCFIKIACKRSDKENWYHLIGAIPRIIPIYVSYDPRGAPDLQVANALLFACIPEYPAKLEDYPAGVVAYSDHTPGLQLWHYYHPMIWEKHLCLERDPNNPDSGVFALTPDQLKEVIG